MPPKDLAAQAKVDRLLCQRSLYYLCKEVLGYKDMVPHVHGELCDFATNPIYGRFRQAEMPRSWFKSWVWTVGKAIWLTLPDEESLHTEVYPFKGPNCRILIASNVIDLSAKFINKIKREWQDNSRLRAAFPELIPDFNKTRWSDHCAELKRTIKAQEGTYTAVGVGGAVIGQHFDHIIEDDLIYAKKDDFTGQELMPNQEDIDNAIGWHKLAYSLLSNPQTDSIDVVGTRWAPHDLIDFIRAKEERYACFRITVTKEGEWPIRDNDQCVWPERYDKITLESIRDAQGAAIFETQYLGRPRVGQDITFDVSYLIEHDNLYDYPMGEYVTLVDLASWKDKKRICNNVILTGVRDNRNHFYVARVDAGHYTPTQVIDLITEHTGQFDSRVYVEEVGYQVALAHFAKKAMEVPGAKHYDISALPSDNRSGAKDIRINGVQPVVKNGALHILKSMKQLRQEMEDYPYSSTKDILDILGWFIRVARPTAAPVVKQPSNPFALESLLDEIHSTHQRQMNTIYDVQLSPNSPYGRYLKVSQALNTPSITQNEGFSDKAYLDTVGKSTIGYGFNISDPAIARFVSPEILTGKRSMSQIEANDLLLNKILPIAANDAQNFVGKDIFTSLSPARKQVILDMAYNLGGPRLNSFKKMKEALVKGDFTTAAQELLSSKYAKQVPNRAKKNAVLLLKGVNEP